MTNQYQQQLTAADVKVGDASPTVKVEKVSRRDIVQYAGASGDFNPIHYDEPYATAVGNESVFGQGMLTAGYAAHMVSDWFGLMTVRRFETRFQARLFPGDSIVITGEIADVTHHDDGATVVGEFEATTYEDKTLLTGEAEADLPSV